MAESVKKAPAKKSAKKAPAEKKASATKKAPTANKTAVEKVHAAKPSHDEIAQLAHKYWAERGHHHGHEEQDWARAEQELSKKA